MKIKRFYGTSVIGFCHVCGKQFGDYTKRKQAYQHAKKTGHKVHIEINNVFQYN